ncbi:MAG TPA: fibronectin type III-like domain-contianing protein, partial [Acidimicrobiales bacterium]
TTWAVDAASARVTMETAGGTAGWVEVGVTNTGDRTGSTVVLLFAGLPGSSFDRPVRRLVAFARVALGAGARDTVILPFDLADLAVRRDGGWFQEPGRYVLEIGTDAGRAVATLTTDVTGAP